MRCLLPPAFLISILLCSPGTAQQSAESQPTAATQPQFEAGTVEIDGGSFPYQLLVPSKLEEGKTYPLVLFLHGAGERGSDNQRQKNHFPKRMQRMMADGGVQGFVLAPQCPADVWWTARTRGGMRGPFLDQPAEPQLRAAMAALEKVVHTHPVDRDRIALTGLSMGGFGSWELAARRPGWFSGVIPICGGGNPRTLAPLAGLPIQVWHGAADRVVPPEASRMMVRALEERGIAVDYHELPEVGHHSWGAAYGDEGVLAQLWQTRRDPAARVEAAALQLARVVDPEERIAFLGDSITQAGNRPKGYVDQIRAVLATQHKKVHVIPAGISGHKVPDLLARYRKDVVEPGATVVFIYIGINDVWHSVRDRGTPADVFEAGLHELIDGLQGTGAEVVLATPSVIGEKTPGENSLDEMLDQYAQISRRVAAQQGLVLCDLRRQFQEHLRIFGNPAQDRGCLTTDGVHLNAAGNQLLAIASAQALREALERRAARRQAAAESDSSEH